MAALAGTVGLVIGGVAYLLLVSAYWTIPLPGMFFLHATSILTALLVFFVMCMQPTVTCWFFFAIDTRSASIEFSRRAQKEASGAKTD
jgi:hypothetical protein